VKATIGLNLGAIVLKPGLTRRVDLGLEPGQVEEKTGEGKTRCDLADSTG